MVVCRWIKSGKVRSRVVGRAAHGLRRVVNARDLARLMLHPPWTRPGYFGTCAPKRVKDPYARVKNAEWERRRSGATIRKALREIDA